MPDCIERLRSASGSPATAWAAAAARLATQAMIYWANGMQTSLRTGRVLTALVGLGLGSLWAADTQPPVLQAVVPPPGAVVSNLTSITVTFSEPVQGIFAAEFLVNGAPASAVFGSNAVYTYTFTQPFPGPVMVRWELNHSIYDLAGNRFDEAAPGASWSYRLIDATPPQLQLILPVPGAWVSGLAQVEVGFSEPVSGVDAADLELNGVPATNVVVTEAGTYLFQFAPAAIGPVTVSWRPGHGITDTAPAPNAFGGGSWSYQNQASLAADVVISEFCADNLNGLKDEDGQEQDWIELLNRGSAPVRLLGWSLTDDPTQPGRWVFPDVTLQPGQVLVVFASAKDRRSTAPGAKLHTNFRLNGFGDYLGLYNANLPRQVVDEFAPAFPEQRPDLSYGRTPSGARVYFETPSPGAPNPESPSFAGLAKMPAASVKSGLFSQPFSLVLSTETPGAQIYYTLDGSLPGPTNLLYTGPIPISGSPSRAVVIVRAAAYKAGWLPSAVLTRTFIFPDYVPYQPANPAGFPTVWDSPCTTGRNCVDIPADYEMDPQIVTNGQNAALIRDGLLRLPSLSIVTHPDLLFGPAKGVYVRREDWNQQPVHVELILPDGTEGFSAPAGLEVQGGTSPYDQGSSWKSKKLSLRLIFKGDFGARNLEYPLFPGSAVTRFNTLVLDNGLNYVWHYNGGSSTEDQRVRAQYVRDAFVSDLQLATSGVSAHWRFMHLYLNGLYWGITGVHERPDDHFAEEYFGGDASEYDVLRHNASTVVAGTATAYNQMFALARSGLANPATYQALQQQLDLPFFIDYILINIWVGNTDWAHQNWYAFRRRSPEGRWRYISWDAEHVLKSPSYNRITDTANRVGPLELFDLLRTNAEFRLQFADHVQRHFFNGGVLATDSNAPVRLDNPQGNQPAALYLKRIREIDPAMVGESARWGDSGTTTVDRSNNPLTRDGDWIPELFALMGWTNAAGHSASFNYFPTRTATVLSQLRAAGLYPAVAAPAFSQHGGRVPPHYPLYITNLNGSGTVYYTTNDVDPRVPGSGAVSPQARVYTGSPVILSQSMRVKARTLAGTNWSALTEAAFSVAELGSPLRITEINYNPPGGDAYEFIELQNVGPFELDLSGFSFEGISYVFPVGSVLAPGARLVLASEASPAAFKARYPGVAVFGWFADKLANGGERLALKDAQGRTVVSVDYDDENGWPTEPDGRGPTLELVDPEGDPDDPANWRPSTVLFGTPGQAPSPPPAPSPVRLNELMADNRSAVPHSGGWPDWVELYNAGSDPVDLTGWSLSDDGNPRKFVFTQGPVLPAGGYLVVWCDSATNDPVGLCTGFALDRQGESLFLYDPAGHRADAVSFGLQVPDLSLGRVDDEWHLTVPTPGGPNVPAPVASQTNLVLNEWLANAPPGGSDWIELYNRATNAPVPLRGLYLATSNALDRVRSLSFIGPGGFAVLWADEQPGPMHLDFKLPAQAGIIILYDSTGAELDRAVYGPQAEGVSMGRLPNGTGAFTNFASTASPAASNYLAAWSGPVLNEVLALNRTAVTNPAGRVAAFIELFNPNAAASGLGGMGLTTDLSRPARWRFPAGASIAGLGYLTVWCDPESPASTNWEPVLNTGFGLDGTNGAVYLLNPLDQVVDAVVYGFQVANLPIGLSAGQWRLLSAATPGLANAAPAALASPTALRLNEWMANPVSGPDWFELFNTAPQPVALAGLYLTDDPSMAGLTKFQVPPLSFIGPRGFVVWVADGQPGRGRYHVNFSLDAQGETLRLYSSSLALLDSVDFGLQTPGLAQGRLPDGSTNIVSLTQGPSPGGPNQQGLVIVQQPQNVTVTSGDIATFSVVAQGTGPLQYQWLFNGLPLPGAVEPVLTLTNVQLDQSGLYAVRVCDEAGGCLTSSNALLTVLVRPVIVVFPSNVAVRVGETARFFVEATGTLPISFRWLRNGVTYTEGIQSDTPTNSTLLVTNVPPHYDGSVFRVAVTNLAGRCLTVPSATLTVLMPPEIVTAPADQTAEPGASVTFTVTATGRTPLWYQWQFNGIDLPGCTNSTLTLSNVQASHEGWYAVRVSNRDGSISSPPARLTVLRPARLVQPERLADGRVRFWVDGSLATSYAVEAGPDLVSWAVLGTVTCTNGPALFVDPAATNATQRFYRARRLP